MTEIIPDVWVTKWLFEKGIVHYKNARVGDNGLINVRGHVFFPQVWHTSLCGAQAAAAEQKAKEIPKLEKRLKLLERKLRILKSEPVFSVTEGYKT